MNSTFEVVSTEIFKECSTYKQVLHVRVEEITGSGKIIKHAFKFEVEQHQGFGKHMTGDLVIKSVEDSAKILNHWRFTVEGYMNGEAEYVLEYFKEDLLKYLRVILTSNVVENIDTLTNI